MTKWQWAALWKKAAKKQRHEAGRYFVAWIRAVVQLGWRGRQARAWKRAAKNYRAMFKLCALTSVPLWKERYWAARRSARAWKRAAKKWRRYAFLMTRDNDSQRAIASQVPYLKGRVKDLKDRVKDLERQIPARTFDIEDYLND